MKIYGDRTFGIKSNDRIKETQIVLDDLREVYAQYLKRYKIDNEQDEFKDEKFKITTANNTKEPALELSKAFKRDLINAYVF